MFNNKYRNTFFLALLIMSIINANTASAKELSSNDDSIVKWNWEFETISIHSLPKTWYEGVLISNSLFDVENHSKIDLINMNLITIDDVVYPIITYSNGSNLYLYIMKDYENESKWQTYMIFDTDNIEGNYSNIINYPRILTTVSENRIYVLFSLQLANNFTINLLEIDLNGTLIKNNLLIAEFGKLNSYDFVISENNDEFYISYSFKTVEMTYQVYTIVFSLNLVNNSIKFDITQKIILFNSTSSLIDQSVALSFLDNDMNFLGVFFTKEHNIEANVFEIQDNFSISSEYEIESGMSNSTPFLINIDDYKNQNVIILSWVNVVFSYDNITNQSDFDELICTATIDKSLTIPTENDWVIDVYFESTNMFHSTFAGNYENSTQVNAIKSPINVGMTDNFQVFLSYLATSDIHSNSIPIIQRTQRDINGYGTNFGLESSLTSYSPSYAYYFSSLISDNKHYIVWLRDIGIDRLAITFGIGQLDNNNDSTKSNSFLIVLGMTISLTLAVIVIIYFKIMKKGI